MSVQGVTSLLLAAASVLGLVVKILGDAKGWFPNKATALKSGKHLNVTDLTIRETPKDPPSA